MGTPLVLPKRTLMERSRELPESASGACQCYFCQIKNRLLTQLLLGSLVAAGSASLVHGQLEAVVVARLDNVLKVGLVETTSLVGVRGGVLRVSLWGAIEPTLRKVKGSSGAYQARSFN